MPLFLCAEIAPITRRNCDRAALLIVSEKWDNSGMEELLERLEKIGFSHESCEQIKDRYDGDEDGLKSYVRFCIALFDDRHEYLD